MVQVIQIGTMQNCNSGIIHIQNHTQGPLKCKEYDHTLILQIVELIV